MSRWHKSILFFNQKKFFKRKEFIEYWESLDPDYLCFGDHLTILTEAGFLKREARGTYQTIGIIPENLTINQARKDAYNKDAPFVSRGNLRRIVQGCSYERDNI